MSAADTTTACRASRSPRAAGVPTRTARLARVLHALLATLLLAASLAAVSGAAAQSKPAPSGLPPEQERELLHSERFRHLASELRCLVCQNQTLADSNADLAVDLRNEVLRQMASGRDDAQIKSRLVDRYGEFVLYRPVLSARNLLLWAGPALLLAIGAFVIWRMSRRGRPQAAPEGDVDARLARIDRLLDDGPGSGR